MFDIIWNVITILISILALGITLFTYVKKQKSDQFRIALDINDRLRDATNELINSSKVAEKKFPKATVPDYHLEETKSPTLTLLAVYEFFSFLVNKKELTNSNIIEYFKRSLELDVEKSFKDFPDIKSDQEEFREIKTLLKKWKEEEAKPS